MEYVSKATDFVNGKDFWYYHGWGLTIAWLGVSFLSIFLKKVIPGKFGAYIHALLFFVCDATTLFLSGGAFYRVYPNISKFSEWSLIKQAHVSAGIVFTLFVIVQHIGGATILNFGKDGTTHKKFGIFLSTMMKFIAVFGWLMAHQQQMAAICLGVSLLETIILLSMGKKNTNNPTKPTTAPNEKPKRQ